MNVLALIIYFAILICILIVEVIHSRKARKREEERRKEFLYLISESTQHLEEIKNALWYEK